MYEDRVTISVDGVIHESNKSRDFESNPILSQCQLQMYECDTHIVRILAIIRADEVRY